MIDEYDDFDDDLDSHNQEGIRYYTTAQRKVSIQNN